MIDFDERDLLALAEEAGFVDPRLNLVAEVKTAPDGAILDCDVLLDSSPNPLAPTLREAMEAALTGEETERLTAVLRPQVEEGRLAPARLARALLSGRKPDPVPRLEPQLGVAGEAGRPGLAVHAGPPVASGSPTCPKR